MSEESDRAQAIASGSSSFHRAFAAKPLQLPERIESGVIALLDAGWVPPAQRSEELCQMAEWQRDARRAFEVVEQVTTELEGGVVGDQHSVAHDWNAARRLRDALGDRFTTPEKTT